MYTCGPTVYAPNTSGTCDPSCSRTSCDVPCRARGLTVDHVVNVTDVGHLTDDASAGEDKVELAARSAGKGASEIARHYEAQWSRDRARLGCLPPTVLCRATEHIPEQIRLIERIEQNGYTYPTPDGVYFDTSRFERYADFAHLVLEAQSTTGRVRRTDDKRHPADFALWKLSPPGVRRQQEWPSPWGVGFPGWHIECTAMAIRYLGPQFDLHTGGIDHIGVHHTNEIAQAEAALGVHPWVRYWLHAAFLNMKGAKLSKSSGPTVLLDDLLARGIPARAYRYFFLTAHYRAPQELSWDALEAAERSLVRLQRLALADDGDEVAVDAASSSAAERFRTPFWNAVANDLNAPRALAIALGDGDVVHARPPHPHGPAPGVRPRPRPRARDADRGRRRCGPPHRRSHPDVDRVADRPTRRGAWGWSLRGRRSDPRRARVRRDRTDRHAGRDDLAPDQLTPLRWAGRPPSGPPPGPTESTPDRTR